MRSFIAIGYGYSLKKIKKEKANIKLWKKKKKVSSLLFKLQKQWDNIYGKSTERDDEPGRKQVDDEWEENGVLEGLERMDDIKDISNDIVVSWSER